MRSEYQANTPQITAGSLFPILEQLGIPFSLIEARGLSYYEDATNLVEAEVDSNHRQHLLTPAACHAWQKMKNAASAAGVDIFIVSAFRSTQRQVDIVRRKLHRGQNIEHILSVTAPPGFSEHHTGSAVDISTLDVPPLEIAFEQTRAFRWLQENANCHGFHLSYTRENSSGFQYEPWHWRYAGPVQKR